MISYKITSHDAVNAAAATAQLQKNRVKLSQAKKEIQTCIDDKGLKIWESVSSWYEMSKPLIKACRSTCGIPANASNAFFKAVEMFSCLDRMQAFPKTIRMFDNASLPGDFIRAAEWKFPSRVDWRANSLVGGLDDRFGLVAQNPERWMMDATMTGDVTVQKNLDTILEKLGSWRADLYTSDLGFGCTDYNSEEKEHYTAHRAQCMLGLRVLERGGSLVVKTFTMFDSATITLLNHMMGEFQEFRIVKPRTSKEDNSECYWVGVGFLASGAQPQSPVFYRSILNISTALTHRQCAKIKQNTEMFRSHARPNLATQVAVWISYYVAISRSFPNLVW